MGYADSWYMVIGEHQAAVAGMAQVVGVFGKDRGDVFAGQIMPSGAALWVFGDAAVAGRLYKRLGVRGGLGPRPSPRRTAEIAEPGHDQLRRDGRKVVAEAGTARSVQYGG